MSDLEKLSAKKLHAVIASRNARWSKLLDDTIIAGMGNYRFSDMVELAKGPSLLSKVVLARDYLNARHDFQVATDELARRQRYHGGDKPIKPSNL